MRKVIISVAPTSALSKSIDPQALAKEVIACAKAGAGMVHMHVRDKYGNLTDDISLYKETVEAIRKESDIVIQASTGGVSNMNIEQRCQPLYYDKVETASLNVGSVNLGEAVYQNPIGDVRYCVQKIKENNKYPEIEVFEIGMIQTVLELDQEFNLPKPLMFDIVLGHKGEAPATIEALISMRKFIPKDALWGFTHAYRRDYTLMAAAIAMGASLVRIGFEDSNYYDENTFAKSNVELVERVAHLIRAIGLEVATPTDVRNMFRLRDQNAELAEKIAAVLRQIGRDEATPERIRQLLNG